MSLIIHDLSEEDFQKIFQDKLNKEDTVIGPNSKVNFCSGSLKCFVTNRCIYDDDCTQIDKVLARDGDVIIVSECIYGCYSSKVKRAIDRMLTYLKPYIVLLRGKEHHVMRYKRPVDCHMYFYGENLTDLEKKNLTTLATQNAEEWNYRKKYECNIKFFERVDEIVINR